MFAGNYIGVNAAGTGGATAASGFRRRRAGQPHRRQRGRRRSGRGGTSSPATRIQGISHRNSGPKYGTIVAGNLIGTDVAGPGPAQHQRRNRRRRRGLVQPDRFRWDQFQRGSRRANETSSRKHSTAAWKSKVFTSERGDTTWQHRRRQLHRRERAGRATARNGDKAS